MGPYVEITHQPSLGRFETDRPVAVHGAFQEFARPQIPEEENSDSGADGQDVALEGHGADAAAVVSRWDLLDGLYKDWESFTIRDETKLNNLISKGPFRLQDSNM